MRRLLLVLVPVLISQVAAAGGLPAADRLAINEAIASYGHRFDRGDAEGLAALFEPDGRWEAFINKAEKPVISLLGREKIAAFAADRIRMFQAVGIETKHFMLDIVVTEQTPTQVSCSAMAIIFWQRPLHGDPLPRPVQTGYYDYVLRKGPEGWRFRSVAVRTSGYYRPEEVYPSIE